MFVYNLFGKINYYLQFLRDKTNVSRNTKMFLIFLLVRLASVFLIQTWYVPDEYWQSMEVAHGMVFSYGYKTWEWVHGLRSYLHPGLIAILYKILHLVNLDSVTLLVLGPRICQAVLSAYADLKFYHWTGNHKWAAFNIACSWFWFYTGSRTLINTFETCISTIALSQFPWPGQKENGYKWLWLVGMICYCRPTAAIMWLPLCAYHLHTAYKSGHFVSSIRVYILVNCVCLPIFTALDSWCHGQLVFTPWEFLKHNVLQDVGSHYGAQPWHWYLSSGLPTLLGIQLLPWLWASVQVIRNRHSQTTQLILLIVIFWTVGVYSLLNHKEFRFILPLLPVVLYMNSQVMSSWSRKANTLHLWLLAGVLLVSNVLPAGYMGAVHQRGTLDVMNTISSLAAARPKDTSFLILMPCHSTPLYSHIHVDIPVRFLTCEPKLNNKKDYVDEADLFYENPNKWLHAEYPPNGSLPSHIVTFDTLVPRLSSILSKYKPLQRFEHTSVPLTSRIGYSVIIHQHMQY